MSKLYRSHSFGETESILASDRFAETGESFYDHAGNLIETAVDDTIFVGPGYTVMEIGEYLESAYNRHAFGRYLLFMDESLAYHYDNLHFARA